MGNAKVKKDKLMNKPDEGGHLDGFVEPTMETSYTSPRDRITPFEGKEPPGDYFSNKDRIDKDK